MTEAYLQSPSYALGSRTYTVEESAASGRTFSPAQALRDAGFQKHHVSPPGETVLDLARRCLVPLAGEIRGTDAILWATCIPVNENLGDPADLPRTRDVKCLMDFPASRLQAELDLPAAITLGISQQACTGLLGSVRVARGLLAAEPEMNAILCVTSDRFPEGAVYEQAYNLISDGAAAWRVSRERRGYRILAVHQITNGALVRASDDETVGTYFSFTHRLIQDAVRKAGWTLAELDWIVPQNMNVKAWQILGRLLDVSADRIVFESLAETAHVVSGDNVVNLKHLEASGRLRPGSKLLLVMAGYGMHWQALCLEAV